MQELRKRCGWFDTRVMPDIYRGPWVLWYRVNSGLEPSLRVRLRASVYTVCGNYSPDKSFFSFSSPGTPWRSRRPRYTTFLEGRKAWSLVGSFGARSLWGWVGEVVFQRCGWLRIWQRCCFSRRTLWWVQKLRCTSTLDDGRVFKLCRECNRASSGLLGW